MEYMAGRVQSGDSKNLQSQCSQHPAAEAGVARLRAGRPREGHQMGECPRVTGEVDSSPGGFLPSLSRSGAFMPWHKKNKKQKQCHLLAVVCLLTVSSGQLAGLPLPATEPGSQADPGEVGRGQRKAS